METFINIFSIIVLVLYVITLILFVGIVVYFAADTINELKEKSKNK